MDIFSKEKSGGSCVFFNCSDFLLWFDTLQGNANDDWAIDSVKSLTANHKQW